MSVLKFFLSLLVALATGCAITPPVSFTPDGMVQMSLVTVTPGVDGTAVTTANICLLAEPQPDATKRKVITDPKGCVGGPKVMQYANTPTAAGVITNTVPVAVGQIIQAEGAKSAIRESARICKDGNCPSTGPTINVGANATAGASLANTNSTNVEIGSRLPCAKTGGCTGINPSPAPSPTGN